MIPYTTFPRLDLGVATVNTFGVTSALGVVVGLGVAVRHATRAFRIPSAWMYTVGAWVVLAGFLGARVTWVLSNLDTVSSGRDVVGIDQGGLQFSGGFLGAILVAAVTLRQLPRAQRWAIIDSLGLGLAPGLAIGRVGCLAVGEHLGGRSSLPLAVRYDGGPLRETFVGADPVFPGTSFHHTALYELAFLVGLSLVLWMVARRRPVPGTLIGVFSVVYGAGRFLLDLLRVNDERLFGLTGAQYLMAAIALGGIAVLFRGRVLDVQP